MLDWFRYRYQLSKLQAKKRREVRACLQGWPKVEELKALSFKDMEALRDPVVAIDEDIAKLLTSYLCSEAQKLFLPVSNVDDDWEWTRIRRHYCLTNAAMVKLRSAIRAEKKKDLRISVHGSVASLESLEFSSLHWQSFLDGGNLSEVRTRHTDGSGMPRLAAST